ncbi:hypothetical protein [Streptomyces scabiei]|uniref:hypothetical protein n=1 Tax=Streptomyces scabiei TaxID=1930 RepID=UPI0038D5127E
MCRTGADQRTLGCSPCASPEKPDRSSALAAAERASSKRARTWVQYGATNRS